MKRIVFILFGVVCVGISYCIFEMRFKMRKKEFPGMTRQEYVLKSHTPGG